MFNRQSTLDRILILPSYFNKFFKILLLQKLKPGALVLLRNSARDGRKGDKFQARYLGPYEIAEDLGKGVFRLRNPTTGLLLKKSVNACRLKPYRKKKQHPPLHLGNNSLFQVRTFSPLATIYM